MRVITPVQIARRAGSKYLGVLVAAKYARKLNEFRRGDEESYDPSDSAREKLTTTALDVVVRGGAEYTMVDRRRPDGQ